MIKKIFILIIFTTSFFTNANSAGSGSGDGDSDSSNSNYNKAVSLVNSAKKYEKKDKKEKATKNYEKANFSFNVFCSGYFSRDDECSWAKSTG